jgi:UDP-N-acetylglucosamine--N-acetylmuramyl-(pentapeptide) pyrophosphoryl-undecaprenol N-acetylglucosamine transferase
MSSSKQHKKFIISGGGTGGHIFPAIAIARALQELEPETKILFVGAEGKMEMEKVPAAGFEITGLPVRGFLRKITFENVKVLINLIKSLKKASVIIRDYVPDAAIGTGGYASGPILRAAGKKNIPTAIQEQNSYPGVTNKILAGKASRIFVAYPGMDKYFPTEKIMFTGNPVRINFKKLSEKKNKGIEYFGLDPSKKTLLILGGSLGARTINRAVMNSFPDLIQRDVQILWQCGKIYFDEAKRLWDEKKPRNIILKDFISKMDLAYAVADVVISRAGAGTISELCLAAKPCVLVPSPNVAEDHQTKNTMTLVNNNAALLVRDNEAEENLLKIAIKLMNDNERKEELARNISKLAVTNSAKKIAEELFKLVNKD